MKPADRIFLGIVMMLCGAIISDNHLLVTGATFGVIGLGLIVGALVWP